MAGQLTLARVRSALDGVLWGAWVGELGVGTVVRSRRGGNDWREGGIRRLRSSIPYSRIPRKLSLHWADRGLVPGAGMYSPIAERLGPACRRSGHHIWIMHV